MKQLDALQYLMKFLDRNRDLPTAQFHMVRDGGTGWCVYFELAYGLGNEGTEEAAKRWAHALGAKLTTGPKVDKGTYFVRELTASSLVVGQLQFQFREKLVYLHFAAVAA